MLARNKTNNQQQTSKNKNLLACTTTMYNIKLNIQAVSNGPSSYYHRPMVVIPKHQSLFTICIIYTSGVGSLSHTKMCQQHTYRLMIKNQPHNVLPFHYACLAQWVCKIPDGTPPQDIKCRIALPCRCSNLWLLSHVLFWMAHCLTSMLYLQH